MSIVLHLKSLSMMETLCFQVESILIQQVSEVLFLRTEVQSPSFPVMPGNYRISGPNECESWSNGHQGGEPSHSYPWRSLMSISRSRWHFLLRAFCHESLCAKIRSGDFSLFPHH